MEALVYLKKKASVPLFFILERIKPKFILRRGNSGWWFWAWLKFTGYVDLNHIWPHYTSVSYLWSWDIKYRTHLFMTVLRDDMSLSTENLGTRTLDACRHYASSFYCILLLCCHRFFMIRLLDPLPNASFLLSFWTVCYSSYINCFPTFPCCSLLILRLAFLSNFIWSSSFQKFLLCIPQFSSVLWRILQYWILPMLYSVISVYVYIFPIRLDASGGQSILFSRVWQKVDVSKMLFWMCINDAQRRKGWAMWYLSENKMLSAFPVVELCLFQFKVFLL